jgi:acetyl-CoA carboxylase biotin carboxyl carrier protein
MTKIDKTDIENIKLIIKETKIGNVSKFKIKKGDYEIEISSKLLDATKIIPEVKSEVLQKNSEEKTNLENINEENIVKSPMVGVAYLSADPNSPPYVKIGQHVKAGDILLLIEAMKTFNEIKAPKSGVIKKIVALNSQPVEFGDHLIIFE